MTSEKAGAVPRRGAMAPGSGAGHRRHHVSLLYDARAAGLLRPQFDRHRSLIAYGGFVPRFRRPWTMDCPQRCPAGQEKYGRVCRAGHATCDSTLFAAGARSEPGGRHYVAIRLMAAGTTMVSPSGSKIALALLIAREKVSHRRSGLLSGGGQGGIAPESPRTGNRTRTPSAVAPRRKSFVTTAALRTLRGTQSRPSAPAPGPDRAGLQACGNGQRLCSGRNARHACVLQGSVLDLYPSFLRSQKRLEKILFRGGDASRQVA